MLIGVVGPQGSGKTLISMFLARCIATLSLEITIYTNANATGSNVVVISDLGEIPFDRNPKILILDEAMFSVDSRRAGSESNVIWTRAVAFFRKANFLAVFFATHTPTMIDNRIREQMQYFIMCRKNKLEFQYMMLDMFSQQIKTFKMPKDNQKLYDFVSFDTYDFPNPIETELLMKISPLFRIKTKKDRLQNQK